MPSTFISARTIASIKVSSGASRQAMTMENVSQSMARPSLQVGVVCTSAGKLAREEIPNQRRLDIGHDHRLPDRFQQNEGEPPALDLLVLRHQLQQRIGADFFL